MKMLKKPMFWQICTAILGGYIVYKYVSDSGMLASAPVYLPVDEPVGDSAADESSEIGSMLRAVGYY